MQRLTLTYSIADQDFETTKSIGILNLSLDLLTRLAERSEFDRLTVLSNRTLADRLKVPASVPVQTHDLAIRSRLGRIWWDQRGVYEAAARTGNRWLFLPKGFAPIRPPRRLRLAVCVADANHEYYRRHYPTSVSLLERWYFRRGFWASIYNADVIFTISEFTSSELVRLARERGGSVPPIHTLGIGFERPPFQTHAKENQIVVLVSRWPHKRSELAVKYLERWQREVGYPGMVHWVGNLPKDLRLPVFPTWRHHRRLPESEYRPMLAQAQALVYFSDYEGFGMPPVEAVIAGTCPVYSDLPATREVMTGFGCPFSNVRYESFVDALQKAMEISQAQLQRWSEVLLRRFTWEGIAGKVVTVLNELDAK